MSKGELDNRWPGPDDKLVVTAMLADTNSPHWNECLNFVRRILQRRNLPTSSKEELVQMTMIVVFKSLPEFRYECRFRTWLRLIVHARIVDEYRNRLRNHPVAHSHDPPEISKHEADHPDLELTSLLPTPEETCLIHETLREVLAELLVYANTHRHPERDCFILQKVLLESRSREEVARELDISAATVGYVVRTAQQHLRNRGLHL